MSNKLIQVLQPQKVPFLDGVKSRWAYQSSLWAKRKVAKSTGSGQNKRNTLQHSSIAAYYINMWEYESFQKLLYCIVRCFCYFVYSSYLALQSKRSVSTEWNQSLFSVSLITGEDSEFHAKYPNVSDSSAVWLEKPSGPQQDYCKRMTSNMHIGKWTPCKYKQRAIAT